MSSKALSPVEIFAKDLALALQWVSDHPGYSFAWLNRGISIAYEKRVFRLKPIDGADWQLTWYNTKTDTSPSKQDSLVELLDMLQILTS